MPNYADIKSAVELLSGGSNTVIFDDVGLPSIMVIIPKKLSSELINNGVAETTHPAFIYSGTNTRNRVAVSKYQNTVINNRAYSLPFKNPKTNISYDEALLYCSNKGERWQLMPYSLWCAIGLWCRKNNTLPHGNTNNGSYMGDSSETGVMSNDERYANQTATGSGPATWFHNKTFNGIADMVGNVQEWCSGLRLVNGEIQVNSSISDNTWWAINNQGELIETENSQSLKFDMPTIYSNLSISYTNDPQDLGAVARFRKITEITSDIATVLYDIQLLKELVLVKPDMSSFPDAYYSINGFAGIKYPAVGGYCASGLYGDIFGKSFEFSNTHRLSFVGFRSAYYGI